MTKNVKIIDRGWLKLKKQFSELNNSYTAVGHIASKSGQDNVTKAVVNNFGSKKRNIPARNFQEQTEKSNKRNLEKIKEKLITQMIDRKITPKQALFMLGEWYTGRMKYTIRNGSYAELNPATILKKGSSRPLIDTGEMRNSTTHIEVMK